MRRDIADQIVEKLHDLRNRMGQGEAQPTLEFNEELDLNEDDEDASENALELGL